MIGRRDHLCEQRGQERGEHENGCDGGGSCFDFGVGICLDAAYATICLCNRPDDALCLSDQFH